MELILVICSQIGCWIEKYLFMTYKQTNSHISIYHIEFRLFFLSHLLYLNSALVQRTICTICLKTHNQIGLKRICVSIINVALNQYKYDQQRFVAHQK